MRIFYKIYRGDGSRVVKQKLIENSMFTIDNILIVAYFLSFWIRFFTDLSFFVMSIIWFCVGCAIVIYTYVYYLSSRKLWKILFVIDSIAFINSIINQNGKVASVAIVFIAQSFGILLYKNRNRLIFAEKMSLITIIYLFFQVYISKPVKISSWEYGIIISKLLGGNSASIVICMCLSIYALSRYNAGKHIEYWPFLVNVIIAYKIGGNGGILSSLVFFILIFFLDRKSGKFSRKKILIFSGIALLIIIWKKYYVYLFQLVTNDNSRLWMWRNYWDCMMESAKNIFFGASVDSIELLAKQKNIHNTYINWHYCFGLIPFLAFLYLIFRSTLIYLIEKRYLILIISFVLFLRAATDEASFAFMPLWSYMWLDFVEKADRENEIGIKES